MLYTRKSFTVPASSGTSQRKWDYTFLTKEEFISKYGEYSLTPLPEAAK